MSKHLIHICSITCFRKTC